MTPINLLSPARDATTAREAILHGADAVYIGAERFGARQGAGNSVADIGEVCRMAHTFGARVFVTVNTILYDDELADAQQLAWDLYRAGADALIVQDMAFMKMDLPPIPLHASTQMDNQTAEQVRWLGQLGFEQVVLARELTLAEIQAIHRAAPEVALEAFVHGSTCVCYNGRCYASQHCFHRSANRGECAQFCRLPFDLIDGDGHELIHQQHLLSLHDMCRADSLEEMLDAGITCLKIEGRLKDTAYVKNVTAAYSRRLDDIIRRRPQDYRRASLGSVRLTFEPDLARSFNRGFTDYFLHGRNKSLVERRTPKSVGQRVGTVKDVRRDCVVVAGLTAFTAGDGLCYFDAEGRLGGFRANRVEGNHLYVREPVRGLMKGMTLYRNLDQAFERQLSRPTAERRIPVRWTLREVTDGFELTLSGHEPMRFAYPHQEARTPQRENIERQLSRLGDTPYTSEGVTIDFTREWFIPASTLAEWRRALTGSATSSLTGSAGLIPATASNVRPLAVAGIKPALPVRLPVTAANRLARAFYAEQGFTDIRPAFELDEPPHARLMTTRYCLRYELGMCTQSQNSKLKTQNSLALRLADGRTFPLRFDCRRCLMHVMACLALLLVMAGCAAPAPAPPLGGSGGPASDSLTATPSPPWGVGGATIGYNFTLWADSLVLDREVPSLAQALVDSPDVAVVYTGEPIVVADIYVDTTDVRDSVWVKIANGEGIQGWVHESELLPAAVPDDPISEAIMLFSNGHIKATLLIIVAALIALVTARGHRRPSALFSPYPTLLCLTTSGAAVLYASLQKFAPEVWTQYYFHPTLNPFALPPVLCAFVGSVWLIFIFMIAVADDVMRQLRLPSGLLYALTLAALLGTLYVVFSLSTLYYVGYPLYIIYMVWAVYRYITRQRPRYRCGQCGMPMHDLGRCPRCQHTNE